MAESEATCKQVSNLKIQIFAINRSCGPIGFNRLLPLLHRRASYVEDCDSMSWQVAFRNSAPLDIFKFVLPLRDGKQFDVPGF